MVLNVLIDIENINPYSAKNQNAIKPLVIVGIPAYNEEKNIAKLVLQSQKYTKNVLVCDDGSTDMTKEIAKKMGAEVFTHNHNRGYGAAISSLIYKAKEMNADVLITIDGDGQHDPNDIPTLIEPILENKADIVIGSRFLNKGKNTVPRLRGWGIKIISKLTNFASRHTLNDAQCGFRVYGRKAISQIKLIETGMGASVELLMRAQKLGLTVIEVSTECKYNDLERSSTQNPIGHLANVLMSIFRFTIEERPLLMLGLPGMLLLFSGTAFGIWMLRLYAEEQRIVTNVALAAISFILIGIFVMFTSITLYAISRVQKN